ncbi:MAG: ring-opening amidohydrolase [Pseudolabrys sp.]
MAITIEIFHPRGPDDALGLLDGLRRLPLDRVRRLAILGKTEGPATLNDFSRQLAQSAVDDALAQAGGTALLARTTRLFSTGCEGIVSPVTVLLADIDDASTSAPQKIGLAFGAANSSPLADADRASAAHLDASRDTVRLAMADASLAADQVALVLIKSPILSGAEAARQGGDRLRHGGSTGSARGAAALGAGLALGEIEHALLGPDPVSRTKAYARRVMAFSGTETDRLEAVVIGMRPGGDARWGIRSSLVDDIADGEALGAMRPAVARDLVLVLMKAGISSDGTLRGRRTTVLTSDLPADKQLRAAASGVIAACFGGADAFISAGAEHLGPPGACLCSVIVKR